MWHMPANPRLNITFTKLQIRFLEQEAARLGISLAEAARRIVERAMEKGERK
jgi:hypothetical protein